LKQIITRARVDLARKIKGRKKHEVQEFEVEFEDGSSESILNQIPDKKVNVEEEVIGDFNKEKSDKRTLIAKLRKRRDLDKNMRLFLALLIEGYSENKAAQIIKKCHKKTREELANLSIV